jgi:predicted AlkP superfamily pyrophosphatase or phosphodiesterase
MFVLLTQPWRPLHIKPIIIHFLCWILSFSSVAFGEDDPPIRLILQITVDQLRGDLPLRYEDRLSEGGFKYLADRGTVFRDAHHRHANTETIVGHTTLATGADPSIHGMVANVWLDRSEGELKYNVEDARYPILNEDAGIRRATEIDPTQKTARTDGRSPAAIMVSTLADELAQHHAGKAKVFGVSVKDRGAISMAGHAGKAFWFSKKSGEFVTSRYYYEQYPEWVANWNAKRPITRFEGQAWNLLADKTTYLFGERDDQPWEVSLGSFGRTFPHEFGLAKEKYFTTYLTLSPAADELTLDFAMELIENENLGKDEIPDYLSISFSSTDYIGHLFGPSSLESEDQILRLDRTLEKLFQFVDRKIGLDKTVIVLSADHGGPEAPGYVRQLGFETDYIVPGEFDKAGAIEALKQRFGIGDKLIHTYFHPYLYLNRKAIREHGLDQAEVEQAVCDELVKFDGVNLAVSSSALARGEFPESPVIGAVMKNFQPKRSGDIYVVFDPHRFINDFDGLTVACTHGSPWRYDTFVPLMFAGPGIPQRRVDRTVYTVGVAPTLAKLLGIKSPSGAMSPPLTEVLDAHRE